MVGWGEVLILCHYLDHVIYLGWVQYGGCNYHYVTWGMLIVLVDR